MSNDGVSAATGIALSPICDRSRRSSSAMADSVTNSPARSLGEPASLTDSDPEGDSLGAETVVVEQLTPQQTIVDGWLKFRDARRWKQRWGVVTKLSPAADCLHLQLYRDSKDRYKQGQTKASLSLQHFLGVETGFTLDKESNTIAIICQDVTVILAFDTRERLIQWQVKISNNLGDDQQYLVQITSAPPKAKLATGPARLHIMDQRFCITTGVPPRLAGYWEIAHLRRYGVVEGRFCFEGGSRCGRGEGLHVCACDRAEEVAATVRLAADGRLALRRRPLARKMSAMESPRRQPARPDTRASDVSCAMALMLASESSMDPCPEDLLCPCRLQAGGGGSPFWSSAESAAGQLTELDCNYGCGDTTSVRDLRRPPSSLAGDAWGYEVTRPGGGPALPPPLERCASCISKLGAPALSRSSTATAPDTPSAPTPFSPAWTMDGGPSPQASLGACMCASARAPSSCGRASVASLSSGSGSGSGSGGASEYCVPRLCAAPDVWYDRPRPMSTTGGPPHLSPHSPPSVPPKSPKPGAGPTTPASNNTAAPCPCCPPSRPPKPPQTSTPGGATDSPSKKKPRKPPMPLPLPTNAAVTPASGTSTPHVLQAPPSCHCPHYPGVVLQQPLQQARLDACSAAGPYDNYDVPKPLVGPQVFHKESVVPNQQVEYYDTPKKLKDSLSSSMNESMFGNYDTPPVVKTVRKSCGCVIKYTTKKSVVTTSQMDSSKLSEHDESGVSAATHCPCQRVMYWAENWMMLPYCRRGNGMENTSVPIHKVKLSGEGKMPVVNASGEIAIYATVDKNKKTSRRLALSEQQDGCSCPAEVKETPDHAHTCPKPDTSNYVNVEATTAACSPSANQETADSNQDGLQTNYENIDFAQSLEYYENARDVLQRAGVTQQEVEALANELDEAKAEMEDMSYLQNSGFKFCNKCGHACHIPRAMISKPLSSAATPDGPPEPPSTSVTNESISGAAMVTSETTDVPTNKQDDYLMMEPGKHLPNQGNKNFPGYLPMSPITNPNAGYNKLRIDQGLPAEKSASIPSLTGPMVDRSRKRSESEFPRVPGSAMMMMHHSANSPYLRRLLMDTADDTRRTQLLARKRSSSADSSRYLDGSSENFDNDVIERPISSSQTKLINPEASTMSAPQGTSSCAQSEQESVLQRPVTTTAMATTTVMTSTTVTTTVEATTLSSATTDVTVPSPAATEVVSAVTEASPSPSTEVVTTTITTTTAAAVATTVVTSTTTSLAPVVTMTAATAPVAVAEETDSGSTSSGSPRSQPREMIVTNIAQSAASQPHETLSPSSVHIRRSSSVPCKGNNRDSSSSNDSGVSTGSLRHRGADFAEFELPLTTATSARRHAHALLAGGLSGSRHPGALCLHASLPRRSKSVDPLRELSFQFQKIKVPAKSSSAEAEVPICPAKRDGTKGFQSPGGEGAAVVAYMDSRSTSSGTSDMSDYIETLSLSSHSSSDTPDSLRLGRPATTTLRPRSGKEYQLIDRSILEGDLKSHASGTANVEKGGHHLRGLVPPYTSFTPVPEKAESPSPGYMSASPGQEREDQPLIAHAYPK